jgi:hypothetical protein
MNIEDAVIVVLAPKLIGDGDVHVHMRTFSVPVMAHVSVVRGCRLAYPEV